MTLIFSFKGRTGPEEPTLEQVKELRDVVGKGDDYQNDGYHFKADTTTRSVDDITIKAGSNEFVLACVWKNLPNYKPCLPNLKKAFDNYG